MTCGDIYIGFCRGVVHFVSYRHGVGVWSDFYKPELPFRVCYLAFIGSEEMDFYADHRCIGTSIIDRAFNRPSLR